MKNFFLMLFLSLRTIRIFILWICDLENKVHYIPNSTPSKSAAVNACRRHSIQKMAKCKKWVCEIFTYYN